MDTQFKMSTYDRWMSSNDYGFHASTAHYSSEAPEERNHIAKGIAFSLPISALLWCGLLAMLLHR